mgnify:CR=1 FL=1
MKKLVSALTIIFFSSYASAQTYSPMSWGMNKAASPYDFGTNINGIWYNLGKLSSSGVWTIPSSNLTFTPSGTGAVTETVQGKLSQYAVTPEEYGAYGDCSHDDTTAIQRAINASSNVEFNNTSACYLTNTITVSKATQISIKPGVTVKRKDGTCGNAQVFSITSAPFTTISGGGRIDGNRSAFAGCIPSFNAAWTIDGVYVRSSDVTVKDITIQNVVRNAFNVAFSDRLNVNNVSINNTGTGLNIQYSNNINISNINETSMGNNKIGRAHV